MKCRYDCKPTTGNCLDLQMYVCVSAATALANILPWLSCYKANNWLFGRFDVTTAVDLLNFGGMKMDYKKCNLGLSLRFHGSYLSRDNTGKKDFNCVQPVFLKFSNV